jgi:uncharacterized protein YdbL (DUF1318 family)
VTLNINRRRFVIPPMKSLRSFRFWLVLVVLSAGAASAPAQDLDAVKARMERRLDAVNTLKDRGAVGENNRGFLDLRGNTSGLEQQMVSDENADRRTVYAALAERTGATADAVGRQRALQLATLAKRGHWVQSPNGEWRQKG